MARTSGRSEQEIEQLIKGFKPSGLTRQQYCEQHGIAVTSFDYYWLRRPAKKKEHSHSTPVVKVELTKSSCFASAPPSQQSGGFSLVLANSRRIESGWVY